MGQSYSSLQKQDLWFVMQYLLQDCMFRCLRCLFVIALIKTRYSKDTLFDLLREHHGKVSSGLEIRN